MTRNESTVYRHTMVTVCSSRKTKNGIFETVPYGQMIYEKMVSEMAIMKKWYMETWYMEKWYMEKIKIIKGAVPK